MDNSDKGLTVPKWVLKNQTKVPKMPKNLSAQIVYPCTKVWDFDEKRLYWASVVRCVYQLSMDQTRHFGLSDAI